MPAMGASAPDLSGLSTSIALGLAVGCGSAWSGTGGPVLLLPILLFFHAPTRTAIAMGQSVQLPIAFAATAVNLAAGTLDLKLGLVLGALLALGWGAGFVLMRRMPTELLARILAFGLIAVGLWYGWQTFQD